MDSLYTAVADNIKKTHERMAKACAAAGRSEDSVQIMAVSKTQPIEKLEVAYSEGLTLFGENRVQELMAKSAFFKDRNATCHIIGTLQTNKVKYLPEITDTVQSVDSLKLAQEISRQYTKAGKCADILLEINIGKEESKSGADPALSEELSRAVALLPNIRLRGFMCIPPICEGDLSRRYFAAMYRIYSDIAAMKIPNTDISVLSMGMSEDFAWAIMEGSTLIRVGRGIFGERIYPKK